MTRSKKMPLQAFDPQLIQWLTIASQSPVRLTAMTPEERKRLPDRVRRLREVKVRLVEENPTLGPQVAGVWIRLDKEAGVITIESRDSGLAGLKADFEASLAVTPDPKANPVLAEKAKGLDKFLQDSLDGKRKKELWED